MGERRENCIVAMSRLKLLLCAIINVNTFHAYFLKVNLCHFKTKGCTFL
nr:MAG TPA: hypothetical protein [Caudoviricetes sp.]